MSLLALRSQSPALPRSWPTNIKCERIVFRLLILKLDGHILRHRPCLPTVQAQYAYQYIFLKDIEESMGKPLEEISRGISGDILGASLEESWTDPRRHIWSNRSKHSWSNSDVDC